MDVLRRNNVRCFGNGFRPMLFAHGFGCDQSMWRYITPAFEDAYRIILFDYVGCGKSDLASYDSLRYSSLEGYAQDILDICQALHLRDVTFVGHSVSSMTGIIAAKKRPELFNRMIMLGPSACYINEPGYEGGFNRQDLDKLLKIIGVGTEWADGLGKAVMANPKRPELAMELISLFCDLDPAVARQFAQVTFLSDSRSMLAEHGIPTLIMQCSDDVVAPISAGEYIKERIQEGALVQLQATGHFPQMSAPDETISTIWDYLDPTWE